MQINNVFWKAADNWHLFSHKDDDPMLSNHKINRISTPQMVVVARQVVEIHQSTQQVTGLRQENQIIVMLI